MFLEPLGILKSLSGAFIKLKLKPQYFNLNFSTKTYKICTVIYNQANTYTLTLHFCIRHDHTISNSFEMALRQDCGKFHGNSLSLCLRIDKQTDKPASESGCKNEMRALLRFVLKFEHKTIKFKKV